MTSGRVSASAFGYMKSGRESGAYVPDCDGVGGRLDAAVAAVDLDRLELVLVLLVVREPEVAERALVAADALDDHVVVLASRL